MKNGFYLICFVVIYLIIGIFNSFASAAEFTADLLVENPAQSIDYKLYVKSDKYRLENKDRNRVNDMPPIIIKDRNKNITWALFPLTKKYTVLNESETIFIDPIRMFEFLPIALKAEKKFEGVEIIKGYKCNKYVYILESTKREKKWQNKPVEKWVSMKLDHIIKGVTHEEKDSGFELFNIREEPIDNNLFEIPSSYEQFKR